MTITTVRILSAVALFCCTVIVGAFPPIFFEVWRKRKQDTVLSITNVQPDTKNRTKSWFNYNNIIKILMFFGGGVLLATCFIHLIPEVRQNLDHFFEAQNAKKHPDHSHDHGHDRSHHGHDHAHADAHHNDHVVAPLTGKMNETEDDVHGDEHVHDHDHDDAKSRVNAPAARGSSDHDAFSEGHGDHSHGVPYVELAVCLGFFLIYLLEEVVHTFIGCSRDDGADRMTDEVSSTSSFPPPPVPPVPPFTLNKGSAFPRTVADPKQSMTGNAGVGHQNFAIDLRSEGASIDDLPPSHPPLYTTDSSDALVIPSADFKASKHAQSKFLQPLSVRFLQGFVVIVAFSAHSIFDGVAVGLQEESSSVWTMFFAICSHKLVVALAVG